MSDPADTLRAWGNAMAAQEQRAPAFSSRRKQRRHGASATVKYMPVPTTLTAQQVSEMKNLATLGVL